MRIHASLALVTLLVTACTEEAEPTDPAVLLPEFADALGDDVYDAVWAGIDAEGLDLYALEDGDTHSGELDLSGSLDGEVSVTWALTYEIQDEAEGIDRWYWDFEIDIERLALSLDEIAGQGSWSVEHERYDYHWQSHDFSGQLSVNGDDAQDVDFEAFYNGNLHWVRGTMGDVEVDYDNPDADEC